MNKGKGEGYQQKTRRGLSMRGKERVINERKGRITNERKQRGTWGQSPTKKSWLKGLA
jgi:hypothetical protein